MGATPRTLEPVTTGGWYRHDDGTWGEYLWIDGQVVLSRTAAHPETQLEQQARWDREAREQYGA